MTVHYRIRPERRLVCVRMEGQVAPADIGEYRRALAAEPEFSATLSRLIDVRGMAIPPSTGEIRDLAATLLRPGPGIRAKRAIVAERDVVFGMFRMLESLVDQPAAPPVRVFRRKEEALEWIGAPPPGGGGGSALPA